MKDMIIEKFMLYLEREILLYLKNHKKNHERKLTGCQKNKKYSSYRDEITQTSDKPNFEIFTV